MAIGFAGGYAYRWYRSRIEVSLETHVQQSWSDRSVHMSITNHGNGAIIVDSWTVHVPMDDVLPGVGEKLRELTDNDKKSSTRRRLNTVPSDVKRIWSRICRRDRLGRWNELSRELARSMLHEVHFKHQLLDPGTTQRIEPGESTVRTFPRTSANPQEPKIASEAERLTIIPSCHIAGHRRRIWGWPTFLAGGSIPVSAQLKPPRTDEEVW